MSLITIDVNIQQLKALARKVEQVADEQSLVFSATKGKSKADLSFNYASQPEVTLSSKQKKRDISQTKKLY